MLLDVTLIATALVSTFAAFVLGRAIARHWSTGDLQGRVSQQWLAQQSAKDVRD